MQKRLHKVRNGAVVSGVCTGFGEYFGIDPVIIRIIWLRLFVCEGAGLILYIICALVMPND